MLANDVAKMFGRNSDGRTQGIQHPGIDGLTGCDRPVRIERAAGCREVLGFRGGGGFSARSEYRTDLSEFFNVTFQLLRIHRYGQVRNVSARFDHEVPLDHLRSDGHRNRGSKTADTVIGETDGDAEARLQ